VKTDKNTTNSSAEPAELPDDTEIKGLVDYEEDYPRVFDPDPDRAYFFAAQGDPSRPDGVERKRQEGYVMSSKKHNSPDCALMEISKAIRDHREAVRCQRMKDALGASMRPAEGLEKIDGYEHSIRRS
jgi:hypothetical protein